MTDQWTLVAAERGAIADDVAGLKPEQWATATLCPSWTVRDVVAHMTATASLNPGTFFVRFATAGFNFEKFVNREIRKHLGPTRGRPSPRSARSRTPPRHRPDPSRPGSARSSSTARTSAALSASPTPTTPPPSGRSPTSTRAPTPSSGPRTRSPDSPSKPPIRTGATARGRSSRVRCSRSSWR